MAWAEYYASLQGRNPRPIFFRAMSYFPQDAQKDSGREAADLGCGDGTETLELLKIGWSVLAIDKEEESIALLNSKVHEAHRSSLISQVANFESLQLPERDFIFAGFSLPFTNPAAFPQLWKTIVASLRPGGIFAGQLFGTRDSWSNDPEMTFHTRDEVDFLLSQVDILSIHEIEEEGRAFSGPKHWHLYDIVMRARQKAGRL